MTLFAASLPNMLSSLSLFSAYRLNSKLIAARRPNTTLFVTLLVNVPPDVLLFVVYRPSMVLFAASLHRGVASEHVGLHVFVS